MARKPQPGTAPVTARRRLVVWAAVLGGLILLSGAWAFLPVRELFDLRGWLVLLSSLSEHPAAPLAAFGGFLAGSLVALPVTLLVIPTVAAFGPIEGFLYSVAGVTLSGLTSFALGRALGRRQLEALAGSRLHTISLKLRRAGVTAVAAVRMFPFTHFTVVSLAAGVSHIRIRDFVAGTVLGMAPGIGAIAIFFDQLSTAARRPSAEHLLWLAAISLMMFAMLLGVRRLVRPR